MKILSVLALFLSLVTTAQISRAQDATKPGVTPRSLTANKMDAAKEADIRHLLELSGSGAIARQTMDRMSDSIKPLMTSALPAGDYRDKLIDLFFQKFKSKLDVKQLIDLAVIRYDQHFSDEEIRGLIAFYQTPVGQRAVSELPKLTAELQQDGEKLGEQAGRESMVEVLQEHPEFEKAMQAAASPQSQQ